jgi:hypothetical protein
VAPPSSTEKTPALTLTLVYSPLQVSVLLMYTLKIMSLVAVMGVPPAVWSVR